jgi:hypothetical protein
MEFLTDLYSRIVTFADNHGRYVLLGAIVLLFVFHPVFTLGVAATFAAYAYYKNEKPSGKKS